MTTLNTNARDERALSALRVADAMHPGVLTCPIETPLRDVASMLATHNVHCVAIVDQDPEHADGERTWAVVSDLDLVGAALHGPLDEHSAGSAAGSPAVPVSGSDTLERAAQLMNEHQTSHLLVLDPRTADPVGVLSTLDVAAALVGEQVRSGPPRAERTELR